MRMTAIITVLLFLSMAASAQERDRIGEIMAITGVRGEEELSEQLIERFENLERHPLMLNVESLSGLLSSGLFTQYQAASIIDYRNSYGDILSLEELSAVDGFGREVAAVLGPYVSFFSKSLPGWTGKQQAVGTATLRSVWTPDPPDFKGNIQERAKIAIDYGTRASAFLCGNLTYRSGNTSSGYTFNAVWHGRRHLDKLVLGDFNARFGQGLTCWSGFSLGGMAAPSSLQCRQTGVTASNSSSGTGLRGVGLSTSWGHFMLSAFSGLPWIVNGRWEGGLTPGINLSYLMKYGQISATGIAGTDLKGKPPELFRTGLDARFCIRGIDIFGEVSTDFATMSMAGIGGAVFPIGKSKLGVVGRYYPQKWLKDMTGAVKSSTYARDEAGATLSFERGSMVLCANAWRKLSTASDQLKLMACDEIKIGESWTLRPRLTARSDLRTEVRLDVVRTKVPWTRTIRLDWLHNLGHAGLVYFETGYDTRPLTAYFRVTAFHVDRWDDRIYTYERDAPGNYNMPAYYGRGAALALNAAWRPELPRGRLKLYSGLNFKYAVKPGSDPSMAAGLKLQCVYDF